MKKKILVKKIINHREKTTKGIQGGVFPGLHTHTVPNRN